MFIRASTAINFLFKNLWNQQNTEVKYKIYLFLSFYS